jgi:hypothetical protein
VKADGAFRSVSRIAVERPVYCAKQPFDFIQPGRQPLAQCCHQRIRITELRAEHENDQVHELQDIAELVGIAAIVASLIAVVVELRQSTQELQFATLDSTVGIYKNWRDKVIENDDVAEIRRKGMAGEELNPNQALRLRLLMSQLMYAYQAAYVRIMNGANYSEGQEDSMRRTILNMLRSEAVRNRWTRDRFGSAYTDEFVNCVDSLIEEF